MSRLKIIAAWIAIIGGGIGFFFLSDLVLVDVMR